MTPRPPPPSPNDAAIADADSTSAAGEEDPGASLEELAPATPPPAPPGAVAHIDQRPH
ncbi:hypothetical protein [Roseateles sp. BYS96W]|uniref:Uncharacterized protein n=1 Tax=Pelomonas nitida TaxID=3299027 RepID=A0ABW7G0Z4_9BURK